MAKTQRPRSKAVIKVPLEQIRERIDSVDSQLHALINERARLAQQVGVSKHAAGHTVDFYRPERESQVLRLALQRNQKEGAPLRDEEVLRLFREIMSACLAQQNALKIGYLGPEDPGASQLEPSQHGVLYMHLHGGLREGEVAGNVLHFLGPRHFHGEHLQETQEGPQVHLLAQDDALLDIPPRVAPDRQFDLPRPVAVTLGLTFLVILPLACAIAGVWIRHRRRHA